MGYQNENICIVVMHYEGKKQRVQKIAKQKKKIEKQIGSVTIEIP